jgi:enamine deaminase RidA (YjgF/YER057c/UK114 family)
MPLTVPVLRVMDACGGDCAEGGSADLLGRLVPAERGRDDCGGRDYAGQAAACVETMTRALAAAGAMVEDVISTRVFVASSARADLVAAWEVVRDAFGEHDVPSTLMGVTVLGYDDQLVEVEAVAAVVD